MWSSLRHAVAVRTERPEMHACVEPELLDPAHPAVLGFVRRAPGSRLVALHSFSDDDTTWPVHAVPLDGALHDLLTGAPPPAHGGLLHLEPYGARWLVRAP